MGPQDLSSRPKRRDLFVTDDSSTPLGMTGEIIAVIKPFFKDNSAITPLYF